MSKEQQKSALLDDVYPVKDLQEQIETIVTSAPDYIRLPLVQQLKLSFRQTKTC